MQSRLPGLATDDATAAARASSSRSCSSSRWRPRLRSRGPPGRDRRRDGGRLAHRRRARVGWLAQPAALRKRPAAALLRAAGQPAARPAARTGARGLSGVAARRGPDLDRLGGAARRGARRVARRAGSAAGGGAGARLRAGPVGARSRRTASGGRSRTGLAGRAASASASSSRPGRPRARYTLDPLGEPAPKRRFGRRRDQDEPGARSAGAPRGPRPSGHRRRR